MPDSGAVNIGSFSLSSPPLMVVTQDQGSLLVLAMRDVYSAEPVGFPPDLGGGC